MTAGSLDFAHTFIHSCTVNSFNSCRRKKYFRFSELKSESDCAPPSEKDKFVLIDWNIHSRAAKIHSRAFHRNVHSRADPVFSPPLRVNFHSFRVKFTSETFGVRLSSLLLKLFLFSSLSFTRAFYNNIALLQSFDFGLLSHRRDTR